MLEAAPRLGPVGAGILLQPTGLAALARLGLLDAVLACGEPIARVDGRTVGGRKVLDRACPPLGAVPYGELRPGMHGLGIHRGALFTVLHDALREAEVPVRLGVAARRLEPSPHGRLVGDSAGDGHGPFDLVVVADGARSTLSRHVIAGGSVRRYPWGALWAIVEDPHGRFRDVLRQVYRGTREMLGFLPPIPPPDATVGVVVHPDDDASHERRRGSILALATAPPRRRAGRLVAPTGHAWLRRPGPRRRHRCVARREASGCERARSLPSVDASSDHDQRVRAPGRSAHRDADARARCVSRLAPDHRVRRRWLAPASPRVQGASGRSS